ncbi:MAG: hypothetical protein UD936_10270 [Acutalibacteraceae bacterium]|nr:hypothetical protein [Acutalibacteraceae bacterium]
MSFFDEFVDYAKSAANTVGKKAGQLKDYSKLKYSESGIKSEISKKKQALGDYVYSCTKTGEVDQKKMQAMVDEITELEENLQITKEMIISAKNRVVCKVCKTENEKDFVYCCKCGQKLNDDDSTSDCHCDVTVVASSTVDDITSEPVEEEPEDITVAQKQDESEDIADCTVCEADVVADDEE